MKIRPLHDRVLAERTAEVGKTSGGLFILDNVDGDDHIILGEDDILAILEA